MPCDDIRVVNVNVFFEEEIGEDVKINQEASDLMVQYMYESKEKHDGTVIDEIVTSGGIWWFLTDEKSAMHAFYKYVDAAVELTSQ